MAKRSRKSGIPRLQDQQYGQIIASSLPEAEKLLQRLGVMISPLEKLPYSRKLSAGMALAAQGVELSSRFIAPDLSQLKEKDKIVAYYARPDVQREMYRYAQGRLVTVLRNFKPMFSALHKPEDVLPLMFHYLKGAHKPSIHGTILRRNAAGKKVCDFVFEPDFKKNWAVAFSAARPVVRLFMSMGLPFFIKFSAVSPFGALRI